jgi:hypothetical protein
MGLEPNRSLWPQSYTILHNNGLATVGQRGLPHIAACPLPFSPEGADKPAMQVARKLEGARRNGFQGLHWPIKKAEQASILLAC